MKPILSFPDAGLLPSRTIPDLGLGREHNPLLVDLTRKRCFFWQGRSFPAAVFETRYFFQRTSL